MAGSFFEMSNLTFTQIVGLLHHFSKETSVKKAAQSLELEEDTVCYWYKVRINTWNVVMKFVSFSISKNGSFIKISIQKEQCFD